MTLGVNLDRMRSFYARLLAVASGSNDPRIERAFDLVPREAFLPPGPWLIPTGPSSIYLETPDANPIYLYQNVLVALDAERGIHTGEPALHARWIATVAPQPGETLTHIGAGMGYYSAILSILVLPGGHVAAFEIDPAFALAARANLAAFEAVTVTASDACSCELPPSDVIYVNAAVAAPPARWLAALKPGGRMIFPWRPACDVGLAVLVTRLPAGYAVKPLATAWFIDCAGAPAAGGSMQVPTRREARRSRSIHLTGKRAPDASATAIHADVWFSSKPVAG